MLYLLKTVFGLWLLGVITLLAVLGYFFYCILWIIRLMGLSKKIFFIALSLLVVLSGAFCFLFLPIGKTSEDVSFVIAKNSSIADIADSLKSKGVITSSKALRLWLKITKIERKIQAGKVSFIKGDGVINASRKLLKAVAIERTLTIPEGLTIEQTAKKVWKVFPSIDTILFSSLCKDSAFIALLKIEAPTLEGYLFPETYRFPEDVTAREVVSKMVHSFERSYESLQPDMQISKKFTKNQIITIASIVEKEAAIPSEQTRISAVFHNRLRIGYPLGADPTVRYALRKFNGPLTVSDLNNSSLYNTRKYSGLPPGPICSPGAGALQAAMSPAETKELYFVAKWDGSGAHDFSFTNEEHNRKKIIIRQYNEARKKAKVNSVSKKQ